ncbi:MAG: hypothetical protein COA71_04995 [SAR86 cluster bacterium]|uniref:Uncharacterized protein n=1 Tax=SAR86 cluster bacterium TaxID=2030880 RepID=A0A2A5CG59_9GAMM|nr:MAG: hypothetical protein COA71_04995 [SAR86 cluster bacterium]
MMFMLTPPQTHYDGGLGITATNFYNAGKLLKENEKSLLDGTLPLGFLLRHAIELFLKSFIYILHKKYDISFSCGYSLEKPGILHNDKWKCHG